MPSTADNAFHVIPHCVTGFSFVNRRGTPFGITVFAEAGAWNVYVRGQYRATFRSEAVAIEKTADILRKYHPEAQPCLTGKGSRLKGAVTERFFK